MRVLSLSVAKRERNPWCLSIDSINAIRDFSTLVASLGHRSVNLALWLLILERFIYFFNGFRRYKHAVKSSWTSRAERNSWNAEQIRQATISRAGMKLNSNLALINVMVALCPLLGLLGTVTGMIEVFDVMAITGTGSARSMASGVSESDYSNYGRYGRCAIGCICFNLLTA